MTGSFEMADPTRTPPTRRIPPPTPTERRHAANWFRLVPMPHIRTYPWMEKVALGVFGLCLLGILSATQKAVQQSGESVASPVAYPAPWKTDKRTYRPGDLVRFSYERKSTEGSLLLWDVSAWENRQTEEVYPEPICGRFVEKAGTEQAYQVRSLPALPPGTYRLRGWVSAQTSRRSRTTGYVSESFRVVAKKGR